MRCELATAISVEVISDGWVQDARLESGLISRSFCAVRKELMERGRDSRPPRDSRLSGDGVRLCSGEL